MRSTGGGMFDAEAESIYFIAGVALSEMVRVRQHPFKLVAVNDLLRDPGSSLDDVLDGETSVLLDSGVFWLTQRHMRAHGVSMDEALGLAPDSIDGFDELFDAYVTVATTFEDRLWGYIELDQGGAVNKRVTRGRLEAMGLNPIPVYHPMNDGWAYFDELCEGYDRICVGNVVQANAATRRHLLATLWERRRRHPKVWIHLLGLTPNEATVVYPFSSSDSSSWLNAVQYGAQRGARGAHSMSDSFGTFRRAVGYVPGSDGQASQGRLVEFLAAEARFVHEGVRAQRRDLTSAFGGDCLLPSPDESEGVRT